MFVLRVFCDSIDVNTSIHTSHKDLYYVLEQTSEVLQAALMEALKDNSTAEQPQTTDPLDGFLIRLGRYAKVAICATEIAWKYDF